jgi:hypothetical protein
MTAHSILEAVDFRYDAVKSVCKNLHMPDVMDFARALYIGAG